MALEILFLLIFGYTTAWCVKNPDKLKKLWDELIK